MVLAARRAAGACCRTWTRQTKPVRHISNAVNQSPGSMAASQDKGYIGMGMEGGIATWYAKSTKSDMALFRSLAEQIAKSVDSNSAILEVAPGPGYLSIELAKLGKPYRITGLDVSKTFVDIARSNAQQASVAVDFQQGNASAMPFESGAFDFIVCRAAFKNFSQPIEALNEMHRVLKPGGNALIVDLNKDASMDDINAYIKSTNLGWVTSMLYRLVFQYTLLPRAYKKQQFADMVAKSRFETSDIETPNISLEVMLTRKAD